MINEIALREGLKKLLKQTEEDILQRLSDEPELELRLKNEHSAAVAAGRSAEGAFLTFRDECKTQAAVHWLLGCVFVRFLEDNLLVDEAWIAGPGDRLKQAQDRRSLFYRENPRANDHDYLVHVFKTVAVLPDMDGLFSLDQNPLWRLGPTGPQAMNILRFFQQRDETSGELQSDFTDPGWSTRFLGDLYQNLSDYAKDKLALCQTPQFVVDFMLNRTLTPAIDAFGLERVTVLDPTCGSGHFLLSAFERLLGRWSQREPSEDGRRKVQRTLDAIFGIDVNPFAVAIGRFRLLIASLKACGIKSLRNAPQFQFQLAVGDSLLHGPILGRERPIQLRMGHDPSECFFAAEDPALLKRILGMQHSVVIGNPPYIKVSDPVLREIYRHRYGSCSGKYQLTVPFIERFFNLTVAAGDNQPAGFCGFVVSNAFIKRTFGKPLVERYLATWDITHIIDSSGAHLPDHGTPTLILFGRHQRPISKTLRAVRGVRGELVRPTDPANAPVWKAIETQIDSPGSESRWISVADAERDSFMKHPWSIGGGGAAELKELLDESCKECAGDVIASVGYMAIMSEDDFFVAPRDVFERANVPFRVLCTGDSAREWHLSPVECVIWPERYHPYYWPYRTVMRARTMFNKTAEDMGKPWFGYMQLIQERVEAELLLPFGNVATHNHFVLDYGGKVFNSHAPVIQLKDGATLHDYLGLLGVLNSSTACFWLKQVCYNKGTGGISEGLKAERWEQFYEYDGANLKRMPIPTDRPFAIGQLIHEQAEARTAVLPDNIGAEVVPSRELLDAARTSANTHLLRMIALQEELDWLTYSLYGILEREVVAQIEDVPPLRLGERAFEILMARRLGAGEIETTWFQRHGSAVTTEIPEHWPDAYKQVVKQRLEILENNRDIALLEQPEYKRRWNFTRRARTVTWEELEKEAVEKWLLDRIAADSIWYQPELLSCARLADRLRRDSDFVQVADLYDAHADLVAVITQLALDHAVPFLPVLRYKSTGMEKRSQWERVWELQREEDSGNSVQIPYPPKYKAADFLKASYWSLRGSLDVPKERFILYPHLQRDADATPVLGWAGWDHLKQVKALATYYQHVKEEEGWGADRLKPVLAGLLELIPWLKQWHNEEDPATGERMGDTFEAFVEAECQEFGFTVESVRAWAPLQSAPRRGRRRT
jgi:hypothetical protein